MSEKNAVPERSATLSSLSEEIIDLIFCGHSTEAEARIESARSKLSADELHHLTSLSAVLHKQAGDTEKSIELMRQAIEERPNWLPHLYRLAVYLMDAERWIDANITLDELIFLSESKNDTYFLDEARIRKILCLRRLGRAGEIAQQKMKVAPGTTVYIGNRSYDVDDLD